MAPKKLKDEKLKRLALLLERSIKAEEAEREHWTEKDLAQFMQMQHALERVHQLLTRTIPVDDGEEQEHLLAALLEDIAIKEIKETDEERDKRLKENESLQSVVETVIEEQEIVHHEEQMQQQQQQLEGNLYKAEKLYDTSEQPVDRLYSPDPADLYAPSLHDAGQEHLKQKERTESTQSDQYKTKTEAEKQFEKWKKKDLKTEFDEEKYKYK